MEPDVHHVRGVGADDRRDARRSGRPSRSRRGDQRRARPVAVDATRARRPSPRCRPTGCRPAGSTTSTRCWPPSTWPSAVRGPLGRTSGRRPRPRRCRSVCNRDRRPMRRDRPVRSEPTPAPSSTDSATAVATSRRSTCGELRVAEFSIAWAGPLTGRFLADLGADVIKVEHPGSRGVGQPGADAARSAGSPVGGSASRSIRRSGPRCSPYADPGERFWNRSGVWNVMNRGKRSLAMDAKAPEGKAILDGVLAGCGHRAAQLLAARRRPASASTPPPSPSSTRTRSRSR